MLHEHAAQPPAPSVMSLDDARQDIRAVADRHGRRLYLTARDLTELPPELFELHHLSHLSLGKNHLTTLPGDIGRLTELEELRVDNNELTALPPEIGNLARLRLLRLERNQLTELPPDLGGLGSLEELVLDSNKLTSLPPEIGRLGSLRRLMLEGNQLTELPPDLSGLGRLEELVLDGNRLTSLPPEISRWLCLSTLSVAGNLLTSIPTAVGSLPNLRSLDLANNRLTHLPSDVGRIECLERLCLTHNHLTRLPSEVGQLKRLTVLDISHNSLAALPSEIGDATNLKALDLRNNRLLRLPSEIGRLSNLESLSLRDNLLTALPSEIGELAQLQSLSLQNNRLMKLPREVARLEKLKTLFLRDDQLLPLPLGPRVRDWDVFISYASEDKETVALPLARALTKAGLRVWIDQQEIGMGDSVRGKIDAGLSRSRFGVVVLSDSYVNRLWTQRELNGLLAIEEDGEKVVLPVWHGMSRAKLAQYSPILADRAAANTQDGIGVAASQIVDVALYQANDSPSGWFPSLTRRLVKTVRDSSSRMELREFLLQHPRILEYAFRDAARVTLTPRLLGGLMPSLRTELAFSVTAPKERSTFCVTLASTGAPWSGGNGLEAVRDHGSELELARSLLATDPEERDWGMIVAGRRDALSEADKRRLGEFNRAHEPACISARTYDWLIDAAIGLEGGLQRRA